MVLSNATTGLLFLIASSISGVIEEPNTDYTVTYTNQYLGNFYVYHSSNNTTYFRLDQKWPSNKTTIGTN